MEARTTGGVDARRELDPLDERGAGELRRRLQQAQSVRVRRDELDPHVALSRRELYELGCTVRPLGLSGLPSAVAGRLQVAGGALLAAVGLAGALVPTVTPILGLLGEVFRDPDPSSTEAGFGVAGLFLGASAGGLALLRRGVRQLRRQAELRRRAAPAVACEPGADPQARTTVAVVRDVGEIRVQLLWLRGDAEDPALVETRVLAEQRVASDDRYAAEDAVLHLLEIAARADAARGLRPGDDPGGDGRPHAAHRQRIGGESREGGPNAARGPRIGGDGRGGQVDTVGRALVSGADGPDADGVDPSEPIPVDWAPEPLTDEGAAELAARLVLARPVRWSAAALAPLVVDARQPFTHEPPPWPAARARTEPRAPIAPRVRRWLRGTAATALGVWIVAAASTAGAGDHTVARWIAYPALAVGAGLLAGLSWRAGRDRGRRLLDSVRAAARIPPRALEQGLPGPAGQVLVLHGLDARGEARLELVHVRALPADGRPGEIEVRTLAWRRVGPGDVLEPRSVALELWRVADDAGFVLERNERTARALRRLLATLGSVGGTRQPAGLAREPLVWLAGLVPVGLVAAAVRHTVGASGGWLEHGLANRILSFAWPLLTAWLLVRAARQFRDPYRDDPPFSR